MTKPQKTFWIIFGCVAGGIVIALVPMADLASASSDLITMFTILAGLLAQMIALTAVIFEPGPRLSAEAVRNIGRSVRGLQTLNIGLFLIYMLALLAFVVIKTMQSHQGILVSEIWPSRKFWPAMSVGTLLQFIVGSVVTLAIIRTFRTLFEIRTLQDLRLQEQAKDADMRDRANRERAAERLHPVPDQGGAAYGEYTGLPRSKRKGGKS